jgi:septal ring factor EnvC (AmiA/AmiB activator)
VALHQAAAFSFRVLFEVREAEDDAGDDERRDNGYEKSCEQASVPEEVECQKTGNPVAPSQTETLQLEESHPEDSQYQLSDLEDKQVAFLVENKSLTPAAQQALHKVLDQKNQVDAIETQIKARRQEQESIAKDQARMRENMKALKGSAEEKSLLQRYTRQLDSQEDRLNTLQEQISDLQERKEKAEAEFEQTIQQISLDETL